jgi:hypothetical protein
LQEIQQEYTNVPQRARIRTRIKRPMLTVRIQIEGKSSTTKKKKEPKHTLNTKTKKLDHLTNKFNHRDQRKEEQPYYKFVTKITV